MFDMIGVAVTAADEQVFHSMAAKKIRGAKLAVKFKKNADKLSSFCKDVIGDICGNLVVSNGAIRENVDIPLLLMWHLSNLHKFQITRESRLRNLYTTLFESSYKLLLRGDILCANNLSNYRESLRLTIHRFAFLWSGLFFYKN